ncbi:MAG: hypothetical protein NVV82_00340 [Sporocytophaga sp.]|nr:hypothetical protein [Sporocytophaga sp.]
METFNKYDRIIILENGKITHLIISEENAPDKTLPKTESDDYTVEYLLENIVGNIKYADLIIFILSQPAEFAVLKQLTASKDFSANRTGILVLALGLGNDKISELQKIGISDVLTEKKNIEEVLKTLTPLNKRISI